jgi:tRNA(Ile)-lysidine synthase
MIVRRQPLVKAVAASLRRDCGIGAGARVVVAVSGGADSVALLRALAAIAPQREWKLDLHIAHVQHHLRDEAEAEAEFVAALAAGLGLKFYRRDIRPAKVAGNLEAAARKLRYAALAEVAAACRADGVATAHHADDQLETLLMRLVRGAGVAGLAGIAPRRRMNGVTIIRPMLWVDHAAAIGFLNTVGQAWCEDHTNSDGLRWRSRLRRDVLPVLRSLRPGAAAKASESALRVRTAARLISRLARETESRHVVASKTGATMKREAGRAMPRELLTEIIRRRCAACGASEVTGRIVENIARAIRHRRGGNRVFQLTDGLLVEVTADEVVWRK